MLTDTLVYTGLFNLTPENELLFLYLTVINLTDNFHKLQKTTSLLFKFYV